MPVVGARFPPRRMDLPALVGILVKEHALMRDGLLRAKRAAEQRDYEGVRRILGEIDPVFKQHIADEEAQVLGLLVARLGVKGAEAEIRVFRQHRPIYDLMTRVSKLAALSPSELEASQAELESLFEAHTASEETQVFPRALSVREKGP